MVFILFNFLLFWLGWVQRFLVGKWKSVLKMIVVLLWPCHLPCMRMTTNCSTMRDYGHPNLLCAAVTLVSKVILWLSSYLHRFPIVKNIWVGGFIRLSQNVRMHMQSAFLRAYECTLKKSGETFSWYLGKCERYRIHSHLQELLPQTFYEEALPRVILNISFPNILYFFLTVYRRGRIFSSSYGAEIGGGGGRGGGL